MTKEKELYIEEESGQLRFNLEPYTYNEDIKSNIDNEVSQQEETDKASIERINKINENNKKRAIEEGKNIYEDAYGQLTFIL